MSQGNDKSQSGDILVSQGIDNQQGDIMVSQRNDNQ